MVKFVRKLCSKFMVPAALQCHEEPCEIAFKRKGKPFTRLAFDYYDQTLMIFSLVPYTNMLYRWQEESWTLGSQTRAKLKITRRGWHCTTAGGFIPWSCVVSWQVLWTMHLRSCHWKSHWSKFVDVRQRAESDIEDVLYFVERLVFFSIVYHLS